MRPLGIEPPLGHDAIEMAHDDHTPVCLVCGKRVGMVTPAFAVLRGSFMFDPERAIELFGVDPDIPFDAGRLPDQSVALSFEVNHQRNNAFAMHEECAEHLVELVRHRMG